MNALEIKFDTPRSFQPRSFAGLDKICGLYFIFLSNRFVNYPFANSKLIYIGMSEKKTNSIASRLLNHFGGESGNVGLTNFRQVDQLRFTYLNFEILQSFWTQRIEDLESYFS